MNKNQKGFTLVELIVVVAVLAILAVAAVMAVSNVQRNARVSTAVTEARTLANALNRHNEVVSGEANRVTAARPNTSRHVIGVCPSCGVSQLGTTTVSASCATASCALAPIDLSVTISNQSLISNVATWVTYQAANRMWGINETAIRAAF